MTLTNPDMARKLILLSAAAGIAIVAVSYLVPRVLPRWPWSDSPPAAQTLPMQPSPSGAFSEASDMASSEKSRAARPLVDPSNSSPDLSSGTTGAADSTVNVGDVMDPQDPANWPTTARANIGEYLDPLSPSSWSREDAVNVGSFLPAPDQPAAGDSADARAVNVGDTVESPDAFLVRRETRPVNVGEYLSVEQ